MSLNVSPIRDARRTAGVLLEDPVGAAYLLGDLEEPYFSHTRWFGAFHGDGRLASMAMIYSALSMPAVLTHGDPEGLETILEAEKKRFPDPCYGHLWPGHESVFEKSYMASSSRRMVRMGLCKGSFRPRDGSEQAAPLAAKDLPDLMKLMEHYPGNFFEPSMFREGLCFGIRLDGLLVSAGGVHTYSPTHGVAAIGNIVTRGDYRRRGLASACTSALAAMLFETIDHIALNVEAENRPAIRCYERLGFESRMGYKEGVYRKKGPS